MVKDSDNDVAQNFLDAIHMVLIDAMKNFIEKHWDEEKDIWYEGCSIPEAFDWIGLHFTPIKELSEFYDTLSVIPAERINFMFSGNVKDLDLDYYKKQFDKYYDDTIQKIVNFGEEDERED